jgi:hypothetical protein
MREIYESSEKAKGAQGKIQKHLTGGYSAIPACGDSPPTLAELGVNCARRDRHVRARVSSHARQACDAVNFDYFTRWVCVASQIQQI